MYLRRFIILESCDVTQRSYGQIIYGAMHCRVNCDVSCHSQFVGKQSHCISGFQLFNCLLDRQSATRCCSLRRTLHPIFAGGAIFPPLRIHFPLPVFHATGHRPSHSIGTKTAVNNTTRRRNSRLKV